MFSQDQTSKGRHYEPNMPTNMTLFVCGQHPKSTRLPNNRRRSKMRKIWPMPASSFYSFRECQMQCRLMMFDFSINETMRSSMR